MLNNCTKSSRQMAPLPGIKAYIFLRNLVNFDSINLDFLVSFLKLTHIDPTLSNPKKKYIFKILDLTRLGDSSLLCGLRMITSSYSNREVVNLTDSDAQL